MSTGRSRYSKIRANNASELTSDTPTPSNWVSGRNRPLCSVVNAMRVPIVSVVPGSPAPT